MRVRCAVVSWGLLLFALIAGLASHAQEVADSRQDDPPINEQTIYIPYDKLREVFERDGRGVFLPYEKFQQLWNEARKNQTRPPEVKAPLGALITDIESTATLGQEIVNVDAKLKIELLREGWHRIPLRLRNAAIRSAKIDDQEARIVSGDDGNYELLLVHEGDQAKTIELELSYARSLTKTGGQSTVAFQSPQAPVNRWTIRTGEKGVDVQIEPMIAASRKSEDDLTPFDEVDGDELLAFVGAAPEVKILWTPKAEGATGLSALIAAETQSRFQVTQGVARTSAIVNLDISRAEIDKVSLSVPAEQKVVSVFDRNVKKWEVVEGEEFQTVNIELFEPTLGKQSLALELERFIDEIADSSLVVPQIKANDVSRNSGVVVVSLAAGLRAEPVTKAGLLQMDSAELPANLRDQKWDFAFRYAAIPFELVINVKQIQPLITADQLVQFALRPEKLSVDLSVVYDIQLAGVFQLSLDIPGEFELREIRPLTQQGLTNIPVDTFYRDPENENRVIVVLGKKAIGKVGLFVSIEKDLDDANLLSPTDVESEFTYAIPKASLAGLEFSKGRLVFYAPESLQVNAAETKGLRNESFQNALAAFQSSLNESGLRPVLAYSFSHTDASIQLTAKRRRPQVTAEQVVVVSVQSGVVKYDARLFYEVLYSGVKSLRLDVPKSLVDQLRNRSPNILYQEIEPQPDDVADGFVAWELTGDNEFFAKHLIRFSWEETIADLPLGESVDLAVNRLVPVNVDRSSGQIVLTKSETIDVRPKADVVGLRPIDPQTDLAQGVKVENAAMAFEFVDDWSLNLTASRFELQELKRTSISRAVVRAVALRQNELSVQCLYQMRSVGQRISIQMPAGFNAESSFDDQPIRVNGRPVTPERGGNDLIFVPLTGQSSDESFLLEIRYSIPGNSHQIDLPVFTDQPAVQKVYLVVYLPYEKALLHQSGPWTDEAIDGQMSTIADLFNAGPRSSLTARMFRRRSENVEQYLDWVHQGVDCDSGASQKFEVDGRPYVFSTLRPEPAPAGSLGLRTLNMMLLNVLVCGALALLGLLLLRARLTTQLAGALIALSILVFTGVFFPLVTEHLFSEALLLTFGIIGLAWLVSDFTRWFREFQVRRREYQANFVTPGAFASAAGSIDPAEFEAVDPSPPPAETDSLEGEGESHE